jgi:hypothetical protein
MKKGQYIRLFLANNDDSGDAVVIARATDLQLHISATVENSTTKDDGGESTWVTNEVTGLQYDISSSALVIAESDDNDLATLLAILESSEEELAWNICEVSGNDNRTAGTEICSGYAMATSLQVNAQNRQNATLQISLKGNGAIDYS